MKVEVFTDVNHCDRFEFAVGSVREALNALSLHRGGDYVERILTREFKFLLYCPDGSLEPVYLDKTVIFSPIEGYASLLIVPHVSGEIGAAVAGAIGGALTATTVVAGVTVTTLTTLGMVVAAVINIAVAVAIGAIATLLTPTAEFGGTDPSFAQQKQSSLFNGAPIIREQGGSVPIVFGAPYCGGVLISSGISTDENVTQKYSSKDNAWRLPSLPLEPGSIYDYV